MNTTTTPSGGLQNGFDSTDPLDELAAMFLTTQEVRNTEETESQRETQSGEFHVYAPTVEVLIVGHLPVRGGVWISPYADAVAKQCGAAAMVRLDGSEPIVQVYGDRNVIARNRELDQCALREAIERVITAPDGRSVSRWIVRPPIGATLRDIVAIGAKRLTILTSADSVAVVSLYQVIKELSAAAEEQNIPLPPIALAVMGSEPELAERIVNRVNSAAGTFLGAEVTLDLALPRIDAAICCARELRFPGEELPIAADLCQWIIDAPNALHDVYDDGPFVFPSMGRPNSPLRVIEEPKPVNIAVDRASEDERMVPSTTKLSPKPVAAAQSNVAASSVTEAPTREDSAVVDAAALILSAHVNGLMPLPVEARCPGHESIELAVDSDGRLHLLGWEREHRAIRIVEHWAIKHRTLLRMAYPSINARLGEPGYHLTCHIFSEKPSTLADLHDCGVQLHVLAPVTVNGQTGWYSAPLTA